MTKVQGIKFIAWFRPRRKHHRPKRNIWDRYHVLLVVLVGRVVLVVLANRRHHLVPLVLSVPLVQQVQLVRLCRAVQGVQVVLVDLGLRLVRARQVEEVRSEQEYQRLQVGHLGQGLRLVLVVLWGLEVLVERPNQGDQVFQARRDLLVLQGVLMGQVVLEGMVCMVVE